MKKRIEDTCQEAIEKKLKLTKQQTPKPQKQKIFIRFEDDTCDVSLDLSGEHLHKRGYRSLVGHAPLRENIASSLLYLAQDLIAGPGNPKVDVIWDPMVGSGTFLLEARSLKEGPLTRDFSFFNWPMFISSAQLKSDYHIEITALSQKAKPVYKTFLGSDIQSEMLELTKQNLSDLKTKIPTITQISSEDLSLVTQDFLTFDPDSKEGKVFFKNAQTPILVVCNPPYGERLKLANPEEFFRSLFKNMAKFKSCLYLTIIFPKDLARKKLWPSTLKLISIVETTNGGLPVQIVTLQNT
jgi:putative N6-adenine-specific DNA methylase